ARASAAGRQPDPSAMAMSGRATPVREAMTSAASWASAVTKVEVTAGSYDPQRPPDARARDRTAGHLRMQRDRPEPQRTATRAPEPTPHQPTRRSIAVAR